jgi:hypothetical protein
MQEHYPVVKPNLKRKAKRTPAGMNLGPTKSNEWSGIAMTKVLGEDFNWIYIVVVLWSVHSKPGLIMTTSIISTQPWGTRRPGRLHGNTSTADPCRS